MPDSMTVVYLLITASFGGIIGFFIGLLLAKSENKSVLQKIWIPGKKCLIEIDKIEKALSIKPPEENFQPEITAKEMHQELSTAYDRLKEIPEKIKKDNSLRKAKLPGKASNKLEEKSVQSKDGSTTEPSNDSSSESNSKDSCVEPPASDFQPEPTEPIGFKSESLSAQIKNLYNRGINEKSDRDLFWETFSITRIGNVNAVAQRTGEVSAPDFREADNGDFLAVADENQNYFVVPLFDTLITSSAFDESGIGYAFECFNYNSQSARAIVKVNRAAIFRRDGEQWFLIDDGKGELVLKN